MGLGTEDQTLKIKYSTILSTLIQICTELENHLGIGDKTLAEFIIDLADGHDSPASFSKTLADNGAELPEPFVATLLNVIQHMRPAKQKKAIRSEGQITNFVTVLFISQNVLIDSRYTD